MRRLNSFIAGGLIAIAIFIIFNCAGYIIFTFIGPMVMSPEGQFTSLFSGNTLPNHPTQVAVVNFVTATAIPTQTPFAPAPSAPSPGPTLPSPMPLLPTITPTSPLPVSQPATNTPAPLPTPTPRMTRSATTKVVDPSQLQILSHRSYVDSLGWYHIVGEVRNNSNIPMEYVEVVAKLYDEADNIIGTKLTFTAPDVIFPGGKAPFDVITLRQSQWQQINEYKLYTKGDIAETLLEQNLVLLNQNGRIQDGFLYVQGQVQNTGSTSALVKLIVTLYDTDYNVINTNWAYADSGIIASNGTSSFEVKIGHRTDPNNYHYRIQIEEETIDSEAEIELPGKTN